MKARPKPASPELVERIEENDLPIISEQAFEFLTRVLKGEGAIKAYRATHSCDTIGDKTVHYRALRLRSNPDVKAWITAARCADIEASFYTRDQHMAALEEIKQVALQQGVPGAAVQCEVNRGKVMGFYEDTLRVKTDGDDIQSLIAQLREQLGPDVANAFAAKLIGKPHEQEDANEQG